jgi:hypothetical protein
MIFQPGRSPRATSDSEYASSGRRKGAWRTAIGAMIVVPSALLVAAGVAVTPTAFASTATLAAFSGGAGTVTVGGTLYAKNGSALTLTVSTSSDTMCVDVAGAFTGHQTSSTGKSSWTFTTTAGSGDGTQAVTATASPNVNTQGKCTGNSGSAQGSYTLDNTGPVVSATLAPVPNAAGWNNSNTTVTWTATDAGSGVGSGPAPASSTESANGTVIRTSNATDRLGNAGSGSVTVRVDKANPTITAAQVKNADGTTTITFTCADSTSGIASCIAGGTNPPADSKTVQPGVTVTGTATDTAGNTATATSTAPAGDTTPPTLTGAPTTSPNGAGWYSGNVTIHWTAADPESGVPVPPADTTITGEGTALTSSTTVQNGAGLSTTATSSPAVKIDRTAPTTGITGTSNNWVNGNVTIALSASDNLSTVDKTQYSIDGGATQTGTSFILSTDGDHAITFFSTDKAGNAETVQSAHVKIDKTAPTIGHTFTPLTYSDGAWTNQNVTVTFNCADQGGSELATCSAPVVKSVEGIYTVPGTATDGAGNSASDSASVRIDKTPPTIAPTVVGTINPAGWYNADVTVTYSANDHPSGVVGTPTDDVLGEGANQSAGATVTDAAGNTASANVTGINVDKTAPTLTGAFAAGWHTGDVTVTWTCTDALSGPAAQPADTTVAGEGDNLSSSTSCMDVADNSTTTTVSGVQIDRTAPTTTSNVAPPLDSGWYSGAVQVTLTGHDNLSGIAATSYTVDGGSAQAYGGAFSFGTEGTHTIAFWSRDIAGNVETAGAALTLKIDTTAPTTTAVNPISPASGWFVTSGIPVAFDANDGAGSGIKATYYKIDGGAAQTYGQPFIADLSNGTHTITYWSVDRADNVEVQANLVINVDTVPPTITGAPSPAANSFGWNNTNVSVTFSCSDTGSGLQTGVAGCSGDTTLTNDGAGQTVHGDAVDVAGNTNSTDLGPINIDKTKPTLVGVPSDPNGAGWYKADVSVTWIGNDAGSGLDPATQPGNSTVTGEGSNLGAGPVTISDKAGNISDPASVTGLKIDRTAPVVTGAPTTSANAAGWYKDAVTVDFACTDNLSGVASCPTSKVLQGDGINKSVTSDPATDVAGNVNAGKTVGGINIDGTAPTSASNNQCTATNGWCTGSTADVVISAVDQTGLSGVKEIHYRIDGGAEQVATGSTKTVSVPLTGSGAGEVIYYAVDNAGNAEPANSIALKWDNIAPTVSHSLSPAPNADDWNKANVTVTFTAKDDDKGSGVASVSAPVVISGETAGTVVTGTATDTAGNIGTDPVTVKLDKTGPTITGAITSGTKNASGWYNGPVTVTFTCSDALAGIVICPDPVVLTNNGANTASGTATDRAGNTASSSVSGINIDQEKPTLTTAGVNVAGAIYTLGAVPAATCTATDSFSGVASCNVTVTGGNANGVGTFTYVATAIDNAGNTTTLTGTFKVIYRFDGFLQPINDTAHQIGVATSVFKAGSTVPVKFQLKNAAGAVVSNTGTANWLTPVKGSAMTVPVDESVYTASADSGSVYRYDGQQYIYNWKTGNGGNYWRIGVTLDDGQTYYVNIGLR